MALNKGWSLKVTSSNIITYLWVKDQRDFHGLQMCVFSNTAPLKIIALTGFVCDRNEKCHSKSHRFLVNSLEKC